VLGVTNVAPSPMSIQTGIKNTVLTNYLTYYFNVRVEPAPDKSNAFLTNLNNKQGIYLNRDKSLTTKPNNIT
jgi:hypothetical protein